MTLSAIRLEGGENFRLCMGLLQHHFFSLFFKISTWLPVYKNGKKDRKQNHLKTEETPDRVKSYQQYFLIALTSD